MSFTFETNGNNTFLVYKIQEQDTLDTMTLGMITNNKIPGFASVLYTQMNMDRYLKYNVTAKVTVSQFFAGIVNRRRLLGVFSGITSALAMAEEYMIDIQSLLLDTNFIYTDVTTCKAEVVCLPVVYASGTTDVSMFFKNIMFSTQFDQTENCDYVARIINYLNSATVFVVEDFRKLLEELQQMPTATVGYESSVAAGYSAPQAQPKEQQPIKKNMFGSKKTQDMPAQPQNQQVASPVPQQTAPQASTQPSMQTATPQSSAQPTRQESSGAVKTGFAVPGQNNAGGFAVPGQNNTGGFAVPGQQTPVQNKASKKQQTATDKQEKEMSVFYLLQHYNKENAAAYKAQKEAKKNAGKAASVNNSMPASNNGFAVPGQQPQQSVPTQPQMQSVSQPQMPQQGQPRIPQPVPQPQVHPAPQPHIPQPSVQPQPMMQPTFSQPGISGENFGDTVLMGADSYGEDTVVISEVQAAATIKPYLHRINNNEKILLEKPVFHIGKERSYVDYCISGNATISRSHADIISKNGQCYIVDNNSTNHTYVNGEMIPSNTEIPLTHGTKIRLSNEEFEFKTF